MITKTAAESKQVLRSFFCVRFPSLHLRRPAQCPPRSREPRLRNGSDLHQEPAAVAVLAIDSGGDLGVAVALQAAEVQTHCEPRFVPDQSRLAGPGAAAEEHRSVR